MPKLFLILLFSGVLSLSGQNSCSDVDFEIYNTGPLPLSAITWTVFEANNGGANSIMCPTTPITYTAPAVNNNAIVMQTPFADAIIGNIPNSPLGGKQVIGLNRNFYSSVRASGIKNTFLVSSSAPIYKYAFITALQSGEPCCSGVLTIFRFYDCSGNMISALSKTYTSNSSTCIPTPSQSCVFSNGIQWTSVPTNPVTFFNQGWDVEIANLSAYAGSCITVEVIASNCTGAAHQGYLYYDAKCSSDILFPALNPSATNFTSCSGAVALSGPPCFGSYLWKGPSTSTVTGLTTQSVNTAVSGIYSLTVTQGSITLSQTIAVAVSLSVPSVSITAASFSGCSGSKFQLQAIGTSIKTYSWSTGATASTINVTPSSTGIYSVSVSDSLGCTAIDTKTIIIHPQPSVQIVGPSTVCPGGSVVLSASPIAWSTYTWIGGRSTGTTSLTPPSSGVFWLSVTDANGCTAMNSKSITVLPSPIINIVPTATVLCPYQQINIFGTGPALVSYTWSTGLKSQFLLISPSVTSVYFISATDSIGCMVSMTRTIVVDECRGLTERSGFETQITILPNPAHEGVEITGAEFTECSIVTIKGTCIARFTLNNENNFRYYFSSPGVGVYFFIGGGVRKTIVFE